MIWYINYITKINEIKIFSLNYITNDWNLFKILNVDWKNEMGQNQKIIKFLKSYHTNKKKCKIKDQKHANKILKQKINEKKKLSPNI